MTTEASKSDHLTAALAKLTHDLEALPGKIAAEVAAQVAAALKPKDVATILVGGKELPVLSLDATGDDDSFFEVSFTVVVSEHADLLRAGSTVKICFNGDPVFTGRLLSRKPEGDTIICRAASSVTADPPLWERDRELEGNTIVCRAVAAAADLWERIARSRSQLQPSANVEVEKALQTLTDIGSEGTPFAVPSQALPTS